MSDSVYKNNSHKPKSYFIQTFGCAMNIADTERFRTILNALEFQEAKSREEADILVFNTCSVRQKAEDRIYGLKKEIEELKTHNPQLITVLTGCMARRRFDNEKSKTGKSKTKREKEIKNHADWIDIVIETTDFHQISKHLKAFDENLQQNENKQKLDKIFAKEPKQNSNPTSMNFLDVTRTPTNKYTAGITISHGCDHMCTFCIVPFARGREINRNFRPILEETKSAIEKGARDIMLLGQTVNRWINPNFEHEFKTGNFIQTRIPRINTTKLSQTDSQTSEPRDFLQLLEVLDKLDGDFWLSFISSHPNYYTKELIDVIAESVVHSCQRQAQQAHHDSKKGHIRPYIHLALQSGSNEVLRRMRRNHKIEEFIEKVEYMKETIPEVAVTTDIIVGFPGETKEQFEQTAEVCKRLKFDQIYISEYSEREGTGSAFLKDDVSHEQKEERKIIINDILRKTALENNQKLIGTTQRVLVSQQEHKILNSIKHYKFKARTKHNKLIQFSIEERDGALSAIKGHNKINPGQFVDLKVTSVTPWALEGRLVK